MRAIRLALTLAAAGLAVGCFDKPKPECAFLCGEGDACPDDYSCRADGWCKLTSVADDFACTNGGAADAAVSLDGDTPDAASIADASGPDADPPDADPPDAFVNSAPNINVPGSPRAITVSVLDSFNVSGSDGDSGQTVTVSAQFPSGSSAMNPFSDGATFTPSGNTGTFSWTPSTAGTYEVEFTATDDYSSPASTSKTLVINVSN